MIIKYVCLLGIWFLVSVNVVFSVGKSGEKWGFLGNKWGNNRGKMGGGGIF